MHVLYWKSLMYRVKTRPIRVILKYGSAPVNQPLRIWINISHASLAADDITITKQNATYFHVLSTKSLISRVKHDPPGCYIPRRWLKARLQ